MELMIKRTAKQSVLVVIPAALIALLYTSGEWRPALSILIGGAISLASFRVIVWGVRKFIGRQMAQPIIMGLSVIKILVIFVILVLLSLFRVIEPIGIVIGFTLVLVIITKEGFLFARRES